MYYCIVCGTVSHTWTGLCYLHTKYALGLTGPHFETLYDLCYFEQTFHTEWIKQMGSAVSWTCDERIDDILYYDSVALEAMHDRVADDLNSENIDMEKYEPMLKSMAIKYSRMYDESYAQMYHDGWTFLKALCDSDQTEMEPKQVTVWLQQRLSGFFLNRSRTMNKCPDDGVSPDTLHSSEPSPLETTLSNERILMAERIVEELIPELSGRQFFVFFDMFLAKEPMTIKALAANLGVDRKTINRDRSEIVTLLRAKGAQYND